jgi:hypothetical protein
LATPTQRAKPVATPTSARVTLPSSTPTTNQKEVELDLEGMMDVTNYAGVDLKEEEFILEGQDDGQDRVKETPFLNLNQLEKRLIEYGGSSSCSENQWTVEFGFQLFGFCVAGCRSVYYYHIDQDV